MEAYDIFHLCGDMAGLLDALGLEKAVFIGHDWGGPVVWNMPLIHPNRVAGVVGMSVPFSPRGNSDPVALLEQVYGPEHYIVHFNRQPGVADAAFAGNPKRFLNNVFRRRQPRERTGESTKEKPSFQVSLISLLDLADPPGEPLMSNEELEVFVAAFSRGGFTGPINWYRNITRNWEKSSGLPQRIDVPCAMIYGAYDIVPKGRDFSEYVPNLETLTLECGHWIQQEKPTEVNAFLTDWLKRKTSS